MKISQSWIVPPKKKILNWMSVLSPRRSPPKSIITSSISTSFCACRRTVLGLLRGIRMKDPGKNLYKSRVHPLSIIGRKKKTLVLDLDETLVHAQHHCPTGEYDFIMYTEIGGRTLVYYVTKRPGLDLLLKAAKEKDFEVVIFTAGQEAYASLLLDQIDPGRDLISRRLYRQCCSQIDGVLVKNLSILGRDLSQVVIVDDNPNSYRLQPRNAVPVKPFVGDACDRELWRIMEFLNVVEEFSDTRDAVQAFLSGWGAEKSPSVPI